MATAVLLLAAPSGAWGTQNRVPMDGIDTLTFYQGKQTNSRRVSAVPQLTCIGGDARHNAGQNVHAIQCRKVGRGFGNDIQWKCEADLPVEYRLGETTVSCEGYENSNDPMVLEGSCGLEYTLHNTGRSGGSNNRNYDHDHRTSSHHSGGASRSNSHSSYSTSGMSKGWYGGLFMVLVAFMVFGGSSMIFYGIAAYAGSGMLGISMTTLLGLAFLAWLFLPSKQRSHSNYRDSTTNMNPFGGWGNGGGSSHSGYNSYGGGGGGGGFWSGLATGAATSAAASNLFSGRPTYSNSRPSYSSSRPSYSSSSSSSSSSGARHTSAGFGGTRNR